MFDQYGHYIVVVLHASSRSEESTSESHQVRQWISRLARNDIAAYRLHTSLCHLMLGVKNKFKPKSCSMRVS